MHEKNMLIDSRTREGARWRHAGDVLFVQRQRDHKPDHSLDGGVTAQRDCAPT